ncbi:MAG: Holliday junction resolvase RuvX [Acidimicrobiia bacterium]|nr:Holliday junction resolvase RuvX [Acidimicrobiia bacterium]
MSAGDRLPGRVLGLDHGSKRVGVAITDPLRITAQALEVVPRPQAVNRIAQLVVQYDVAEIVIGLPVGLSGREGASAEQARSFGARIGSVTGVPISFVDERFSTATAEQAMLAAGVKRARRRQAVDKVAATVILRTFLDRGR